jgi:hypothetical protein
MNQKFNFLIGFKCEIDPPKKGKENARNDLRGAIRPYLP